MGHAEKLRVKTPFPWILTLCYDKNYIIQGFRTSVHMVPVTKKTLLIFFLYKQEREEVLDLFVLPSW